MAIELDLRTALPKLTPDMSTAGRCSYSAPCIIGQMMTPEQRESLRASADDDTKIDDLIYLKQVIVPEDQIADFIYLQQMFDLGQIVAVAARIEKLKSC